MPPGMACHVRLFSGQKKGPKGWQVFRDGRPGALGSCGKVKASEKDRITHAVSAPAPP